MKFLLFCQNAYAFGIMAPIRDVLLHKGYDFIWYIPKKLLDTFPNKTEPFTTSILELQLFKSDVIFVPGNEVPYYLRGLKVQIFHGLAGEKKGHFRIRNYFDLYLTQGPYFTAKFNTLAEKYKNFEVKETGWPKLDVYRKNLEPYIKEKENLLAQYNAEKLILFAPTFSPRLTSAPYLINEIERITKDPKYLIFVKLHDLMDQKWINTYKTLAKNNTNIVYREEKNIVKFLIQADILVSDTSSVIYEFLLLDKPVISFNTISGNIQWEDSKSYTNLKERIVNNLDNDPFKNQRSRVNQQYHPYQDGKSAERMVAIVEKQIKEKGVPETRELSLARKLKINNLFGKPTEDLWDGKQPNKLTALLITFNEINNIDAVLENINFADEVIVVDSNSTDGTIERIAEYPNVKLIQRPFKNYTDQKSYALAQASNDWVLFMDADERLTDGIKNEILQTINKKNLKAVAYLFLRTFMYKDKVLRFSGWQSDKNYRLFRKSKVYFDQERIVHETLVVDGESAVMNNKLIHFSFSDYDDYKGKMIKYGQMKALEEFKRDKKSYPYHFVFRPLYKFLNHYILRLGILDGKKGVVICYLNALGVYSRYKELKRLRCIQKTKNQ